MLAASNRQMNWRTGTLGMTQRNLVSLAGLFRTGELLQGQYAWIPWSTCTQMAGHKPAFLREVETMAS